MASAKYFKQQLIKKYNLGLPSDHQQQLQLNKYGIGESDDQIKRDLERIFAYLTTQKDINDEVINKVETDNKQFIPIPQGTRIAKVGEHNLSYWEQEKERKLKAKERSRQGYNRRRETMLERAERRFAEKQGIRPIEEAVKPKRVAKRDQERFKNVPLQIKSNK